jgi:hypothetical protein
MRLLAMLLAAAALVACSRATAPRSFSLGPGCTHEVDIHHRVTGQTLATLKAHYADCTRQNLDSLRAAGWRIVPDTIYH